MFADAWHPIYSGRDYVYMRFTTVVDVDVDAYYEHLKSNPRSGKIDRRLALMFSRDLTAENLSRRVADVIIAANLASPGSLHTDERVLVGDGIPVRMHAGFSGLLPEAVERAFKQEWPPIVTVPFQTVWEWLNAIPGLKEGQGRGRLGRAVSAFSYLMSAGVTGAPTMGLMWALVGLEALYAKGNQALQAQLIEKSEVILGKRTTHKKNFGRMYDFRSRFVHGDIDFPLSYVSDTIDFDAFDREAREAELLATATLVSTLQQLVVRGMHELEFEYRIAST